MNIIEENNFLKNYQIITYIEIDGTNLKMFRQFYANKVANCTR